MPLTLVGGAVLRVNLNIKKERGKKVSEAPQPYSRGFFGFGVPPRTESHSSTPLQAWLSGAWVK